MDAVRGVIESFSEETGARSEDWEDLVHAGVAEALCRNVHELQTSPLEDPSERAEVGSLGLWRCFSHW